LCVSLKDTTVSVDDIFKPRRKTCRLGGHSLCGTPSETRRVDMSAGLSLDKNLEIQAQNLK